MNMDKISYQDRLIYLTELSCRSSEKVVMEERNLDKNTIETVW